MPDPADSGPASGRTWRVLIADDDRLTRVMLRRVLEQEGCEVVETDNGVAGLAEFRRCPPDLVLLDAMMPELDGFDCCAQMLEMPATEHIPVLMITGLEDPRSVNRAFDAGATDFITKPIHWQVLRRRVRILIEKAQLQIELKAANQQLQQMVMTDSLTQLSNRRRFDDSLGDEWRRAFRNSEPLSLVMCDIDSFKPYNDHYGHPAGDRCLQAVARVLESAIHRGGDVATRYGGEEFAVILPSTSAEGALHVAARIRQGILELAIPHEYAKRGKQISLSLGIATLRARRDISPSLLVTLADEALYQAKAAGGDCCITHSHGLSPEPEPSLM